MEKVSEDIILKTAHLMGVTKAMIDNGYSEEGVKLAFVQSGLFPEKVAEYFVKEAANPELTKESNWVSGAIALGSKVAPWLLRSAKSIGGWSAKNSGKLMQGGKASQLAGKAVQGAGAGAGKVMKGLGKKTYQATGAVRQAGQAMQKAPVKTMAGGVKSFGAGAMFGSGKGVGGGLGRATMYGGMAMNMGGLLGGGSQAGQQQAAQQMMQRYPQQRMYGG